MIDWYTLILDILAFVLGVTVGSFLNVVVLRMRSGMKLSGRSKCLTCGKILRPSMLVPLFSFCYQKGRCAYCHARIALQYPLVEATLGALFVAIVTLEHYDPLHTTFASTAILFLHFFAWAILLGMVVYDLKHKIIPDIFSLLFAVTGLALLALELSLHDTPTYTILFLDSVPRWLDLASGPLLALPFALLWFFSGGRAMGLGDAKIAWGIGWFLGFPYGVTAIIFAFWIAFFPSLALVFFSPKQFSMKSEIPFAPFLILGTLVVYLMHINMLAWTL